MVNRADIGIQNFLKSSLKDKLWDGDVILVQMTMWSEYKFIMNSFSPFLSFSILINASDY